MNTTENNSVFPFFPLLELLHPSGKILTEHKRRGKVIRNMKDKETLGEEEQYTCVTLWLDTDSWMWAVMFATVLADDFILLKSWGNEAEAEALDVSV